LDDIVKKSGIDLFVPVGAGVITYVSAFTENLVRPVHEMINKARPIRPGKLSRRIRPKLRFVPQPRVIRVQNLIRRYRHRTRRTVNRYAENRVSRAFHADATVPQILDAEIVIAEPAGPDPLQVHLSARPRVLCRQLSHALHQLTELLQVAVRGDAHQIFRLIFLAADRHSPFQRIAELGERRRRPEVGGGVRRVQVALHKP